MKRNNPFELFYCNQCRKTTRHEVKENEHTCQACGTKKYSPYVVKRKESPTPLSA